MANQTCTVPGCPGCDVPGACPLNRLNVGACGRVVSVSGDCELRRRLLEMGFCSGTSVQVVRRAPFGDPTEFRLRGYFLSLRSDQASNIMIVPESEDRQEVARMADNRMHVHN